MNQPAIERLRALEKEWRDAANQHVHDYAGCTPAAVVETLRDCADELAILLAELGQEVGAVADGELPGMWSASDFTGGDPDERSHAARNVDHSTSMESWFSAIDDTGYLFPNAPDERFASRASRVMTYLKANRPTSPAHTSEARDAARYRWLRDQNSITESPDAWTITRCDFADIEDPSRYWVGTDLDAAIDAAMEASR